MQLNNKPENSELQNESATISHEHLTTYRPLLYTCVKITQVTRHSDSLLVV